MNPILLSDADVLQVGDLYYQGIDNPSDTALAKLHPVKTEWLGNTVLEVDDLPQLRTYFYRPNIAISDVTVSDRLNRLAVNAKFSVINLMNKNDDDTYFQLYLLLQEVVDKAAEIGRSQHGQK